MVLSKFKNIRAIVLDVDGVLTDGSILVTEYGEQLRSFNVKDGFAMQLAIKQGLHIIAISGGNSKGVERRLKSLGLKEIYIDVSDKKTLLHGLLGKLKIDCREVIFIGDDLPDYEVMRSVGLPICPADAVQEIKAIAQYVSVYKGGEGVVRDIIEKVLKLQSKWMLKSSIKSV